MQQLEYDYAFVGVPFNESAYEKAIISHLVNQYGYIHLYGPDVPRSDKSYTDKFLPGVPEESLRRINPTLPSNAIDEAITKISSIDNGSIIHRNEIFTDYVQNGVQIKYFDVQHQEERSDIVYLIDFKKPENNSFHVVNQWTYVEASNKIPDIVIFINGMPLVVFELKSPSRGETDASEAYLQIRNYLKHIPSFFVYNAFCVISDMAITKVGTITSDEGRYTAWKTVDGNYEATPYANYKTMLDGMFEKQRLLDIIENFICFDDATPESHKILAGYHQYFAVKKAVDSALRASRGDGKAGVFWHTQGSGKSLSMVFFAKLLQDKMDSPTIVVITDRNDLDDQLYGQFARCKDFLRQTPYQATSQEDLKKHLLNREANGIIFTTMQKFTESDEPLSERHDIIVMVDEAHRSQYGLEERVTKDGRIIVGAARIVREALPNASYIGFTGTPLSLDDKNTREIFGDYIDVYDMTQSVEDDATRPIYYESRVVKLKLDESVLQQLDTEYEALTEKTSAEAIDTSKRELSRLDSVLGAPEVIGALCDDIIGHYEENRASEITGKAMIVAYSRPIAMRIYNKMIDMRPEWKEEGKIGVVMTSDNKDPEEWFEVVGGKKHRDQMALKFKAKNDPLKIAIVVDMWLTGFDVPDLATMYVFKPMKGHNLMQAIARVNRVFPEKEGGLIVDYIGIASALRQAMNDYTARDRAKYGNMDIAKTAYPKFKDKLGVCKDLLFGFDFSEFLTTQEDSRRAELISDGVDFLLDHSRETRRDEFLKESQLMNQALTLAKSMASKQERYTAAYFIALRTLIVRILYNTDLTLISPKEINVRISSILEQSVKSEGVINIFTSVSEDVSLFDPSFLEEISKMKQKNLALELLRKLLKDQVRVYKGRSVVQAGKFSDMLQTAINKYINGLLTNEEVIEELLKMAKEMRAAREEGNKLGLNEEELAFYDALTKPAAIQDFYENEELVKITRELTESLRANRTIDWQKKESARSAMRAAVKRLLKHYKYPPENMEDALETVMSQCELWVDNN